MFFAAVCKVCNVTVFTFFEGGGVGDLPNITQEGGHIHHVSSFC